LFLLSGKSTEKRGGGGQGKRSNEQRQRFGLFALWRQRDFKKGNGGGAGAETEETLHPRCEKKGQRVDLLGAKPEGPRAQDTEMQGRMKSPLSAKNFFVNDHHQMDTDGLNTQASFQEPLIHPREIKEKKRRNAKIRPDAQAGGGQAGGWSRALLCTRDNLWQGP